MAFRYTLAVRLADGTIRKSELPTGMYTLGRDPGCDIVIDSGDVSWEHVRLNLFDQDFQVEDLGSTLGTKANGHPVMQAVRLPYPAILQLGSVNISVRPAGAGKELNLPANEAVPPAANPDSRVPYVFGSEIARGGMGSILEAEDRKIGRRVAVKIMLEENATDDSKRRFVQEAAVLGCLAHPNIVPIYDLGHDPKGRLYYSMKLVKGRTLQAIINGIRDGDEEIRKNYTLDRLLTIFRKVCDAVAFAHNNGIVHRDLKPENIMIGEFGEVLVMDWGLAKFFNESAQASGWKSLRPGSWAEALGGTDLGATLDGDVMGTPQYMSPEQADGRIAEIDARSDVFSLGGILYAILTLRPPFEGGSRREVLHKVVAGILVPPSAFGTPVSSKAPATDESPEILKARNKPLPHCPGKRVPRSLSAVTMKALAAQRSRRYQEVAALAAEIEAYQNGYATGAEKAGTLKHVEFLIMRHKVASASVLVLLVLAFVSLITLFVDQRSAFASERRAAENERLAASEKERAEKALNDLRGTAPTFEAQARALLEEGRFDEAIAKISYAVQLNGNYADYRLFRANLLQATQRLAEAAEEYRRVLALRPKLEAAKTNLALCEQLLAQNGGAPTLRRELQVKLLEAIRAQQRVLETVPLESLINAGAALHTLLHKYERQPGWNAGRIALLANGTFKLDLVNLIIGRLPLLRGLPVSAVRLSKTDIDDLHGLAGLPLKNLLLDGTRVTDLSPLADCPTLEEISLPSAAGNVEVLRKLPGVKLISTRLNGSRPAQSAAEFWRDHDRNKPAQTVPAANPGLEEPDSSNLKLSDDVIRHLDGICADYEKQVTGDIIKPHEAALAALDENYIKALKRARNDAANKGDFHLDGAIDVEVGHVIRHDVMQLSDLILSDSLKPLRAAYRTAFGRLEKERKERSLAAKQEHETALERYLAPFTGAQKTQAMLHVSGRLAPPGVPGAPSPPSPPAPAPLAIGKLDFESIDLADVLKVEERLSKDSIVESSASPFAPGDRFLYKTSEGRLGKCVVREITGSTLALGWVTFQANGTVHSSGNNLVLSSSSSCDLDLGSASPRSSADFLYVARTASSRTLDPVNGARFLRLSTGKPGH